LNNVLESSTFSDDLGLKNDLFLFQEPAAKNKRKKYYTKSRTNRA